MTNDDQGSPVIQSVSLAMQILECLASSDREQGVTDLAQKLSATKPRISRHLQTLRQLGYVKQNEITKKVRVGIRLNLLASMVGENVELMSAVRPAMEKLRDQTGQTSVFASVIDGKATIVEFSLGTTTVQFAFKPGATFNLNSSSLGHVSLAFGPEEYWEYVNVDRFERETPGTETDPSKLPARVAAVRDQGWSLVPEEAVEGVNAIAAPVFYHDSSYAGAIAIVGSAQNVPAVPPAEMIDYVVAAGRYASRNLGLRAEDRDSH